MHTRLIFALLAAVPLLAFPQVLEDITELTDDILSPEATCNGDDLCVPKGSNLFVGIPADGKCGSSAKCVQCNPKGAGVTNECPDDFSCWEAPSPDTDDLFDLNTYCLASCTTAACTGHCLPAAHGGKACLPTSCMGKPNGTPCAKSATQVGTCDDGACDVPTPPAGCVPGPTDNCPIGEYCKAPGDCEPGCKADGSACFTPPPSPKAGKCDDHICVATPVPCVPGPTDNCPVGQYCKTPGDCEPGCKADGSACVTPPPSPKAGKCDDHVCKAPSPQGQRCSPAYDRCPHGKYCKPSTKRCVVGCKKRGSHCKTLAGKNGKCSSQHRCVATLEQSCSSYKHCPRHHKCVNRKCKKY